MLISFSNVPLVIAGLLTLFIFALHAAGAFFDGKIRTLATYAELLLHVAVMVLLFFAEAKFDLVVAFVMASLVVYCALNYASYVISKRRGK